MRKIAKKKTHTCPMFCSVTLVWNVKSHFIRLLLISMECIGRRRDLAKSHDARHKASDAMQRRQWTGSETFCRPWLHNRLKFDTQTLASGIHMRKRCYARNIPLCASVCHIIKTNKQTKNSKLSTMACRADVSLESPCSWLADFAPQNETSQLYFRVLI